MCVCVCVCVHVGVCMCASVYRTLHSYPSVCYPYILILSYIKASLSCNHHLISHLTTVSLTTVGGWPSPPHGSEEGSARLPSSYEGERG